jgi:hypothetical protein
MPRKGHSEEEIVRALRQAEAGRPRKGRLHPGPVQPGAKRPYG